MIQCAFTAISTEVINATSIIGGQSVPVRSIFGWIIWMRKTGDTFNWNLPWASYKNGFGSVGDKNYWFGLEKIYQLMRSSKYRLRVELNVQSTTVWYSVEYWSFSVGDETTAKYQLNVDGYVSECLVSEAKVIK